MHVHQTAPGDAVADLLTLDDCDRLLTSSAIRTPAVRLVADGETLAESSYTRRASVTGRPLTGLVNPRTALAHFHDGATVVFQAVHRYHPPLSQFIAELELELGHPCQANAYLTPAGSQGFAVHSDTHDVFVVQTAGTKQWEVHVDGGVDSILMEPGLSMYLPTGTPHAARAQDEVSLHVTIGINQVTWHSLLRSAVDAALKQVPDQHLPAGFLDDDRELRDGLAARLNELAEELRAVDSGEIVNDQVRHFLTTRPVRQPGGLLNTIAAAGVTDATRLRRMPARPCVLHRSIDRPDRLEVLLGDRMLDVPAWIEPALERVQSLDQLRPADLADLLDGESRVVLCRRLVREGLLGVESG